MSDINLAVIEATTEIETASKETLIEAVKVLLRRALEAEQQLEYPIYIPKDVEDYLKITFPDKTQYLNLVNAHWKSSIQHLINIAGDRQYMAISGAMRWEWSQEAFLYEHKKIDFK